MTQQWLHLARLSEVALPSSVHNTDPACQPCSPGLSTVSEGSSKPADCAVAARGYFLKADMEVGGQDTGDDDSGPPPLQVIYIPQVGDSR